MLGGIFRQFFQQDCLGLVFFSFFRDQFPLALLGNVFFVKGRYKGNLLFIIILSQKLLIATQIQVSGFSVVVIALLLLFVCYTMNP